MTASIARAADQVWIELEPGISFTLLHADDTGLTVTLTRFAPNTVGGWHNHPGGEELLVLTGDLAFGGARLGPGDFVYTPPGEAHQASSVCGATVLVRLPKMPVYGV